MKTYKFYDTCSLLLKVDNLFEEKDPIVISSITLNELENIKTATNKDPDVKYAARRLLHMLSEHPEAYEIHIFKMDMLECPYMNICRKYGCPEIVPAFCASDDVAYGNMHPKLVWGRTKTLGRGDECCDFKLTVK